MRGRTQRERSWTALKARIQDQLGASMTEYAVLLAGMALAVLGGLTFLGGAVGGSWADLVINAPLANADYGINPHECKKNGFTTMTRLDGSAFNNQGDCMQYANTGM